MCTRWTIQRKIREILYIPGGLITVTTSTNHIVNSGGLCSKNVCWSQCCIPSIRHYQVIVDQEVVHDMCICVLGAPTTSTLPQVRVKPHCRSSSPQWGIPVSQQCKVVTFGALCNHCLQSCPQRGSVFNAVMMVDMLIHIQKVHVPFQPTNTKVHQPAWYHLLPGEVIHRAHLLGDQAQKSRSGLTTATM